MNKLKFILMLTTISLFVACEYEPGGNNFIELTPPEDYTPVEISLNDIDPSDTIYLFQNTSVSIKTYSSGKKLVQAAVLLDGQQYMNLSPNALNFVFYPDQISEGVHKLTVNVLFSSGTGSLADLMGMEGYMGELSWNIRVIRNPQSHFVINYRINNEGFLEIFWKNALPESLIRNYIVHAGLTQNSDTIINDAGHKYFTDYGYVCGSAYYEVTTCLKDGTSFLQRLSFEKPAPVISFENKGLESLRVSWDHPFANGRFDLKDGNITIASGIPDTTITIPQIFGPTRQFTLETRPQKAGYDNFHNKFSAYGSFCLGISLGLPNWELYAYNITDNIIYTRKYDYLVAFDAATLKVLNTVSIIGNPWGFSYGGKIATAPHKSTVAAMTGEETWIFNDSRFINPIKVASLPGNIHTRLSAITGDDRLFVVQGGTNVCKVFNTLTGEKIFEIPFTYNTIYDIPDFVTVSDDGKFFCAPSENGIEVFEIDGTATTLLYTDTREYKGAMFIPTQPDRLLLRVGSVIEIRQLPVFSLVQSLDVSAYGARLCNIDPASMNLLYHQNDSLKVCRIDNLSGTIFKIRSNEKDCKMFNNKLLTYGKGGICLDINPYLGH